MKIKAFSAALAMFVSASLAHAATGTWTNTVDGSTGYWTNNANWSASPYPTNTQSAFLTNTIATTYTSVLDYGLGTLNTLRLFNSAGQAWLVLTQGTSAVSLNVATFDLGSGGRLRLDNGATLNVTNFNWTGTTGAIHLREGGLLRSFATVTLGGNASSLTGTVVGAGGLWDGSGQGLRVGYADLSWVGTAAARDNLLQVSGGVVLTNLSELSVGVATNRNQGGVALASSNQVWMTGTDTKLFINGDARVGVAWAGGASARTATSLWNQVYVENASATSSNLIIGQAYQSAANAPRYALAASNSVVLAGGTWTNWNRTVIGETAPSLLSGEGAALFNSLIVTNGSTFYTGGGLLVGEGASYNSVLVSNNSTMTIRGPLRVGGKESFYTTGSHFYLVGSRGNTATLYASTADGLGQWLIVGGATNVVLQYIKYQQIADNSLALFGGSYTNFDEIQVGHVFGSGLEARNNTLLVDGAVLSATGTMRVGRSANGGSGSGTGSGNTPTVSSNNQVQARNGAVVNTRDLIIGSATGNANTTSYWNRVVIDGAFWTNSNDTVIGQSVSGGVANNNSLIISNGGLFYNAGALTVGSGATGNRVQVFAGGLLEATNITVGANSAVTNNGGIYQFSRSNPTLTGAGTISLENGVISFRAIEDADVTSSLGAGALNKIRFAGANTFMLNAASNVLAGQTYTFETSASPSNYAGLAMINGATAYRGGDVTIGVTGSFLASNTAAVITGLFTNHGAASIVGASVEIQSGFFNAGDLTLRDAGSIKGAGVATIGGTLAGNGTIEPNVVATGTIAPGESLGTLMFSGELTLQGSLAAELDPSGSGSADKIIVANQLTLSSATLDLTALGTLDDAAYVIASYGSLNGTFTTVNGLPGGYEINYAYEGNNIAVVIPEPSSWLLVALGLLGAAVLRRKR